MKGFFIQKLQNVNKSFLMRNKVVDKTYFRNINNTIRYTHSTNDNSDNTDNSNSNNKTNNSNNTNNKNQINSNNKDFAITTNSINTDGLHILKKLNKNKSKLNALFPWRAAGNVDVTLTEYLTHQAAKVYILLFNLFTFSFLIVINCISEI